MMLSTKEALITMGVIALGTAVTRFLPFLIFPDKKETPPYITYLGKVLPYAVIGLLVVYCLRGISLTEFPFGFAELISVLCVGILHFWKGNTLLSIGAGTIIYMILVQFVFV